MRRSARLALFAAIAAGALAAGVYLRLDRSDEQAAAAATLTRMSFPDLSGQPATIAGWRGKVVVVNFWASWCAPCREEIPGLLSLQRKYAGNGLQVVGIAVDSVDNSKSAAAALGIAYPVLIGGLGSIELTRQLGNKAGALPYTVILDRDGRLVATHLGLISEAKLEQLLRPLLS